MDIQTLPARTLLGQRYRSQLGAFARGVIYQSYVMIFSFRSDAYFSIFADYAQDVEDEWWPTVTHFGLPQYKNFALCAIPDIWGEHDFDRMGTKGWPMLDEIVYQEVNASPTPGPPTLAELQTVFENTYEGYPGSFPPRVIFIFDFTMVRSLLEPGIDDFKDWLIDNGVKVGEKITNSQWVVNFLRYGYIRSGGPRWDWYQDNFGD